MAYTSITFEHPETSAIRVAPVGVSWTALFFGFFPPLFRSDLKYAFIIFVCWCFTGGLSNFVFMFLYNRLYIEDLVQAGYLVTETPYRNINELGRRLRIRLPLMRPPDGAGSRKGAGPGGGERTVEQTRRGPWRESQTQPRTQERTDKSSGVPRVAEQEQPEPAEDREINPWIVEEGDEDYRR